MRPVLVRCVAALVLCATLATSLAAPGAAPNKALDGLDIYIEQVRRDWKNVGVAVAVVQGSQVIYARGFGVKEIGKPDKIDADTLFQVGSTSKAFTTAALGLLVEEGKIRWDDPIVDHLPGFQLQDPWLTRHLTIRDAISHDSGIADSRYSSLGNMDLDGVIRQLRSISAEAPFRNSFRYSNLMYATAGKIVEAASGMAWREFVQRRLLQPLGMSRSASTPLKFWDAKYLASTYLGSAPAGRVSLEDARDGNVAMPHAFDDRGSIQVLSWTNYDSKAAAGAIVASAMDMAKWLIPHLNNGRVGGRQLLSESTVRELHETQNLHGRNDFPFDQTGTTYAMGWFRAEYRGNVHLSHGGGILGFPAHVAMLPEWKIGVVVLSNGPQGAMFHEAIELAVFDRLLGSPRRDWNGEFLERARKARQQSQAAEDELRRARRADVRPSLQLDAYAGIYEDAERQTGRVHVRTVKGGLILAFEGEGAFSAPLEHWHGDIFRLRPKPGVLDALDSFGYQFVSFSADPSGRVASMSAFDAVFERLKQAEATIGFTQ